MNPDLKKVQRIARGVDDLLNKEAAKPIEAETALTVCLVAVWKSSDMPKEAAMAAIAKCWDIAAKGDN